MTKDEYENDMKASAAFEQLQELASVVLLRRGIEGLVSWVSESFDTNDPQTVFDRIYISVIELHPDSDDLIYFRQELVKVVAKKKSPDWLRKELPLMFSEVARRMLDCVMVTAMEEASKIQKSLGVSIELVISRPTDSGGVEVLTSESEDRKLH